MCGITGIASRASVSARGPLALACDAMRHRGPDDAGEWWSDDGRVGLGFRRLAIIDLSPAGHQPMSRGPLLHIAFNGEIYNFRDLRAELAAKGHAFVSQSDTEVILAAYREWGADCLTRMNGMFALAIYDVERQRVMLARDRAGEKPLFYAEHDGTLRFASELKSLLADPALPRRADREAVDCYLAMGFVPGDRCILEGVRKLPPAHALAFDLSTGTSRVWRYWSLPPAPASDAASESELLDELEPLLEDAVRRQLVADVPVGILLSGGVDSSLITALAARAASRVKTFTIRFPGHARYDETAHARLIADHYGTEQIELEAAEATADILPMLARQYDEPVNDSSMIPTYLVSKLVRAHCTVAVGGDGGDELFGGYEHYNRLLLLQDRVGAIPRPLRRAAAGVAAFGLPVGTRGRNWVQAAGADLSRGLPLIASYFDRGARARLLAGRSRWPFVAEAIRAARIPAAPDLLQRATRMDFENYLPEDILVKVDRASMLTSLEVRAPLLDYRIIEFAFGRVPSRLKATPTGRKLLLKQLAARILPPEFDRQRKQGFSIPLGAWLRDGPWQSLFRDVLLGAENTTFDREFCRSLLEGQSRGRSNSERLFGLVLFELWRREYRIAVE